jgi:hypothetical protein
LQHHVLGNLSVNPENVGTDLQNAEFLVETFLETL